MKAPEGYTWIHVCWNDDYGNFNGELRGIEIEEEINLVFDPFSGREVTLNGNDTDPDFRSIKLNDEFFLFTKIHNWLGSMAWDGILMKTEDALRFMKEAGKVGFTELEFVEDSPYFKAFKEGVEEHEQARKNTV